MNMPMLPCDGVTASTVMNGYGAAHPAPDFDTVLTGRGASDVDGRSAFALDHGLHGESEQAVLHQVNASIPCDDGLKHNKTAGG